MTIVNDTNKLSVVIEAKISVYRRRLDMLERALATELAKSVSERSVRQILFLNREWSVYSFALHEISEVGEILIAAKDLEELRDSS